MEFHQFTPGAQLQAGPHKVTEDEIIEFARRYDPQPFHIDHAHATASRWGGLIASGWMTCAIAMKLAVQSMLDGSGSFGSPGVEELRWENPVRPDDELKLSVTVLESRISSSGKVGVVRCSWELHNQNDKRVLSLTATNLFELSAISTGS